MKNLEVNLNMKLLKRLVFACFLLLNASMIDSCVYDCLNVHQGHVVDSKTNKPIGGVNVMSMFNDTIINNYGLKYDTIPIKQRLDLIKQNGNNEGYWNPQDNMNRMAIGAPLYTDTFGYFMIKFMTGACPKDFKLIFLKAGYVPYIYRPNDIMDSVTLKLVEIEK